MADIKEDLAQKIRDNPSLNWINRVCVNIYSRETADTDSDDIDINTDETTAIITDINAQLTDFGNNTFTGIDKNIQIQVFFSETKNVLPDENIKQLLHWLIDVQGWTSQGYSNFIDPDTDQQAVTIKLSKII